MAGTVGFSDLYGPPANGPSVLSNTNPTSSGIGGAAGKIAAIGGVGLPLELPALIILGLTAWWLWHTYE